jgi:hypothetical protein
LREGHRRERGRESSRERVRGKKEEKRQAGVGG